MDFHNRKFYLIVALVFTVGFLLIVDFNKKDDSLPLSTIRKFHDRIPGHTDEQQIRVENRLNRIEKACGPLCDTTRKGNPGKYFDEIRAPISCKNLFESEDIDAQRETESATCELPPTGDLRENYSMQGRVPIKFICENQQYLGKKALINEWSESMVTEMMKKARSGKLDGNYGASETNALMDALKNTPSIKNGRVLVVGSENPWVEATVLAAGAASVLTLEYGEIVSRHPKISTVTPLQFRSQFASGKLGTFDATVSFSSIEHSGLGRYGDALNPWGDILTVARIWCVTRDKGALVLGLMYNNGCDGGAGACDELVFNQHRIYGSIRYPYLTTNWRQVYRGEGSQRLHTFQKISA